MTVPVLTFTEPVGPEDGDLLVLGPSLGTSAILWETTTPILAERYRVTAWDLPGHGASAPARESFTVAELADAVADGIRSLSSAGAFYAGVSLGGAAGLELCLRHPSLVRGAAIIASGALIGDAQAWHERAAQVREQSTSTLIIGSAQRWFAPDSMAREPVLSGRLLHALQDADDESYALCCEALARHDVRDGLARIGTPLLAVWGEFDTVSPEPKAREIADGVERGRIQRIPGAAHLPPAEQPAATAEALLAFFDAVQKETR